MSAHLERLLRIYNRLRRGPVTITIIAKWAAGAGIHISDRQLYRDLIQLQGVRIAEGETIVEYMDEKNRKTWKLEYSEDKERLSQYDLNSFFLFKNFVPFCISEQRKDSLEKFEKIIYKTFSKNKYQQLIQATELYLRRTNYNDNMYSELEHKQMEDFIWALHNNRTIIVEKELINTANIPLPDNSFPLLMNPIELIFHRGRLHIGGLTVIDNKLLIFAIDKALRFSLTNSIFNRKKYMAAYKKKVEVIYGISNPISEKVYHVKLELTDSYGESMKSFFWHGSQRWERLKSGNYMLHLHCNITRELIGFIAIGLDKIKVHQPKVLKDLMVKKLNQTLEVYTKGSVINEEIANQDYKRI